MGSERKRCYFWKQYRYHVSADQITVKGYVDWCNELFEIQHGKQRPRKEKIFVPTNLTEVTAKARIWNKDKIEKWLDSKGYQWTVTEEIKYQFPIEGRDDIVLVDADRQMALEIEKGA